MVLVRLNRAEEEAAEILENHHHDLAERQDVTDKQKQSLDNLRINVYQNAGQYDEAISLLEKALQQALNSEKRSQILWQIANTYTRLEDYESAENHFRQVLRLRPENITVQRNIALCLSKQERYDEAEKNLETRIQDTSLDAKTTELLDAIERARTTGESTPVDDIIIEMGVFRVLRFCTILLGPV